MLKSSLLIFLLSFAFSSTLQAKVNPDEINLSITQLTKQIGDESNQDELAKLYCYRARNHAKLENHAAAFQDYKLSINSSYIGWVLKELGYYLYNVGEYEKALQVADHLIDDFPNLEKDGNSLKHQAWVKYQEEYKKSHPPTIIMDEPVNYNRVTRHQLINQLKAQGAWTTTQYGGQTVQSSGQIMSACANKWGSDQKMIDYCVKQQTEAQYAVSRRQGGVIKSNCQTKWGTDYRMVEYCIKEQRSSQESIDRVYNNDPKRESCETKWGTDYRMVEYCIRN